MNEVTFGAESLQSTVLMMCELLQESRERRSTVCGDSELRYELVACVLSSRVRTEAVDSALERLGVMGLLQDDRWKSDDGEFEGDVAAALAKRDTVVGSHSGYRFPQLRAKQLAQLRDVLRILPLEARLNHAPCVRATRAQLVAELPGVGPKQASMFLRNTGVSYDLAILDVHLLDYLALIGRLSEKHPNVSSLDAYEGIEATAMEYAAELGTTAGYLDWAIWITMRAAKELRR